MGWIPTQERKGIDYIARRKKNGFHRKEEERWIPPQEGSGMDSNARRKLNGFDHKEEVGWIPTQAGIWMDSTTRRKLDGFHLKVRSVVYFTWKHKDWFRQEKVRWIPPGECKMEEVR